MRAPTGSVDEPSVSGEPGTLASLVTWNTPTLGRADTTLPTQAAATTQRTLDRMETHFAPWAVCPFFVSRGRGQRHRVPGPEPRRQRSPLPRPAPASPCGGPVDQQVEHLADGRLARRRLRQW